MKSWPLRSFKKGQTLTEKINKRKTATTEKMANAREDEMDALSVI